MSMAPSTTHWCVPHPMRVLRQPRRCPLKQPHRRPLKQPRRRPLKRPVAARSSTPVAAHRLLGTQIDQRGDEPAQKATDFDHTAISFFVKAVRLPRALLSVHNSTCSRRLTAVVRCACLNQIELIVTAPDRAFAVSETELLNSGEAAKKTTAEEYLDQFVLNGWLGREYVPPRLPSSQTSTAVVDVCRCASAHGTVRTATTAWACGR